MPTAPHTEVSRSAESRHHQASGMHSPTAASSAPAWCRRTELFGPIRRRSRTRPDSRRTRSAVWRGRTIRSRRAERVLPGRWKSLSGEKEKPCRDWCDTPCAATRSENRTLAHQNPTQEAGQAEFKPNALLPGRTRTSNPSVNSRTLCQLSYRGPPGPCERWRSRGTTLAYWCDGAQLGDSLPMGAG